MRIFTQLTFFSNVTNQINKFDGFLSFEIRKKSIFTSSISSSGSLYPQLNLEKKLFKKINFIFF